MWRVYENKSQFCIIVNILDTVFMAVAERHFLDFQRLLVQHKSLLEVSDMFLDHTHVVVGAGHACVFPYSVVGPTVGAPYNA
jgi:hypothetical protein